MTDIQGVEPVLLCTDRDSTLERLCQTAAYADLDRGPFHRTIAPVPPEKSVNIQRRFLCMARTTQEDNPRYTQNQDFSIHLPSPLY